MRDALKAYLTLAGSLTEVTRQRAVAAARALVQQGEATAEQVSALAEDMVAQSRANREAVQALAKSEVDRALGAVGLATADEVADLTTRLRQLETQLRTLTGTIPVATAAPTPRPGAASADVPAEEAPVEKAPVKQAPVKHAPSDKAPVEKAPAKKAPAKKAPAKRAPAAKRAPRKKKASSPAPTSVVGDGQVVADA